MHKAATRAGSLAVHQRHCLQRIPPRSHSAANAWSLVSRRLGNKRFVSNSAVVETEPPPPPRSPWFYARIVLLALPLGYVAAYSVFGLPGGDKTPLDPHRFSSRKLLKKARVSATSSIFSLTGITDDAADHLWTQGVWSVEVKQPQLQIAREYTPLPPIKLAEETQGAWMNRTKGLRFLIRQEPQGEVSSYLHALSIGAKIELRGPHLDFALPQDVSEVIFLAGGTGIAPALQVAYALSRRAATTANMGEDGVRMSILWASRRRDDIFGDTSATTGSFEHRLASLPGQLESLKSDKSSADRFHLDTRYFVDEDNTFITASEIDSRLKKATGPRSGKKLILLSGPDGFIAHLAGPKLLQDGSEVQGPIRGQLAQLDLKGWQIWKL